MKGLSLREKVLLVVLLIAAIFYGYYSFYLNPMMTSMNQIKGNIEALKIQEQKIKDAPAIKDKLNQQLTEATVLYDAALLEVPRQYRNSEIAYDLKALCDANSTTLTSISLGSVTADNTNAAGTDSNGSQPAGNGISSVPVILTVTGEYTAIMNLVNAIENDARTALVNSIGISGGTNPTNSGLTTSINLTYYFIDNGQEAEEIYDFNNGAFGKPDMFK